MSSIFKDSVTKNHQVFVIIKIAINFMYISLPFTNEKEVRHETQI